ncbi:hypothetical protein [Aeromonas sp. AE23HZ002T15]
MLSYFIPILISIIKAIALLCWWSDNSLRQKERDDAIARLKVRSKTADELSDADLVWLRKIYKRRFTDRTIYQHEGLYNVRELAPGWRQRWQDTCVGDVRVESVYWPPATYCKDSPRSVVIRGLIYKDALYAVSVDGAFLVSEVRKSEELSKQWVPREFDVVYLEALHIIIPIFSIFTFVSSLENSIPTLLILIILMLSMLGGYSWMVLRLHRLFVLDGRCLLLPANNVFGERKVINGYLVSDPAKKLQPGECYRLHCQRTHHELFFSPERINNKEYVDGAQSLLFGSRQFNCALALFFLIAHIVSLHNLYQSPAYQVHAGLTEYNREIAIDGNSFSALYDISPQDFIHVSGILAIANGADDTVCLRDNSSVDIEDIKDSVQHIIGIDYSAKSDFEGTLSERYPELYEYLVNMKASKKVSCPITIRVTGKNKYDFDTSPAFILEYISKYVVDDPEALGRRIYENFYGPAELVTSSSAKRQEVKKVISPIINRDVIVSGVSHYVYGDVIPGRYSLSGLVLNIEKKPDGSVIAFLNDEFNPTSEEEIESVYYKILISIILVFTYFITFMGFLIGWFRASGESPCMPSSSST